jgi:SAM-dependent MidA family methyltransferase
MSTNEGFELPVPKTADREKSIALIHELVERMAEGPIPFSEYMGTVLYHPRYGYYGSGQVAFGPGGDFITAPERSSLFTEGIAWEWVQARAGEEIGEEILEIGAGSGRLAIDLLARLAEERRLPRRYTILEIAPALAERQRAALREALPAAVFERLRWIDDWSALDWQGGMVIANEVLDAMPVERFVWTPGRPETAERLLVGFDGARFRWERAAPDPALRAAVAAIAARIGISIAPLRGEVTAEYNPRLEAWFAAMHAALAGRASRVYLFDYGSHTADIYRADREQGTLKCHYRHLAHEDPFVYPGLQDITAWVDFEAVAEAARRAGFEIDGERSQAQWLMGTDVPRRLERRLLAETDMAAQTRLAQEFRDLVMPTEMGERFRVMRLRLEAID